MSMTVTRRKDNKVPRVFMHKIADIRGGVSVNTSELGSDFLLEGAVLSAPQEGICHVVKVAKVVADVTETGKAINVAKGHNFKVGDIVMVVEGSVAHAITAIDSTTNKTYDVVTVKTTLGAIKQGDFIIEAKAESTTTTSELKYIPKSLAGTGKPIVQGSNLDVDAWLIGVTKGNALPECVEKHLKGIINY